MTTVVPTPRQVEFQDWEFGLFLHLGMYTYAEEQDGRSYLRQDPNLFAPEGLDCDQWIGTAKEAGMRYAVLTCKHHEGFCLWPSEHGDYSTKHSSWRDGNGDVVREFTDACHPHPGDSPEQLNEAPRRPLLTAASSQDIGAHRTRPERNRAGRLTRWSEQESLDGRHSAGPFSVGYCHIITVRMTATSYREPINTSQ